MKRLENRVALVTGGLRGIGRGIVERFGAEGAHVMVADLDEDAGDAVPVGAVYRRLDVTRDADWRGALAELEERLGPPDIIVNNAGCARQGSIADTTEEDWRFVIDTNLFSVFLGCRHAVRTMSASGGSIINIASARGKRVGSSDCAYSTSKAAVLALTQSVALHCGEQGLPIRCNAIAPGVIDTPLTRKALDGEEGEAALNMLSAMQVVGRLGTAREVGDAAVFLASKESSFITGTTLDVDGGFAIRDL